MLTYINIIKLNTMCIYLDTICTSEPVKMDINLYPNRFIINQLMLEMYRRLCISDATSLYKYIRHDIYGFVLSLWSIYIVFLKHKAHNIVVIYEICGIYMRNDNT